LRRCSQARRRLPDEEAAGKRRVAPGKHRGSLQPLVRHTLPTVQVCVPYLGLGPLCRDIRRPAAY
ncbi:hypothetical protein GGI12_004550, partial [Dipsacomyces acuminosporus]